MKKKIKTTWRVFSAKRRVTIESLIGAGKFSDYSGYLKYCETFTVMPVSLEEFTASVPAVPPPEKKNALRELNKPVADSDTGLEATVWLAGVKEEVPPAPEEKKTSKKPKKQENTQD